MLDEKARRKAAQVFASTLAEDDETYARLFVDAFTSSSRREEGRRQLDSLRSLGVAQPPSVEDDPVYLRNVKYVVDDDVRLIGAQPTDLFPDCVAVGHLNGFCCTGTLIAPHAVLTAAHCVGVGCAAQVLVGRSVSDPSAQQFLVREVIVHPDYGRGPLDDLAILLLVEDIDVAPRGIAEPDEAERAGSVRLVGYGTTNSAGSLGYGERRMVDVPMASADAAYGADPAREFVAGAPFLDRDSCPGDSGGPAYVEKDGVWLLAGATSRATLSSVRTCGDGGVYERVGYYKSWIDAVIA